MFGKNKKSAKLSIVSPISAVADAAGQIAESAADIIDTTSIKGNATQRQENDMLSDNKLSKSIRPVIMIWAMLLFTGMVLLDVMGHPVSGEYKSAINLIMGLAVGFYFPGRTIEKWIRNSSKPSKEDKSN